MRMCACVCVCVCVCRFNHNETRYASVNQIMVVFATDYIMSISEREVDKDRIDDGPTIVGLHHKFYDRENHEVSTQHCLFSVVLLYRCSTDGWLIE